MIERTKQITKSHQRLFKERSGNEPMLRDVRDSKDQQQIREQAQKYDDIIRQQKDQLRQLRGALGSSGLESTTSEDRNRPDTLNKHRSSGTGL